MTKFFVGQRVRIKWSDTFKELDGTTGRIIKAGTFYCKNSRVGDFLVVPDVWGGLRSPSDGLMFAPTAEQLEPIIPEGHQPCGESYGQLMDRLRSGVVA